MSLTHSYTPEIWATAIGPFAAVAHVPLEFAVEALREESAGNPCAIGNPEELGPDGNPREMGVYQFYNPDDLKLLKVTGAQLRAYCSPNKVAYHTKDGRTVLGPSQEVIRPLTAEEMTVQAKATVDKIAQSRSYAAHYAMLAEVRWPPDSIDFWRLVKLVHGLPGIVSSGLPNVHAHLGRAPNSWAEFRQLIQSGTVKCDANTEAYRSKFAATFDNAEAATATMQGRPIG